MSTQENRTYYIYTGEESELRLHDRKDLNMSVKINRLNYIYTRKQSELSRQEYMA